MRPRQSVAPSDGAAGKRRHFVQRVAPVGLHPLDLRIQQAPFEIRVSQRRPFRTQPAEVGRVFTIAMHFAQPSAS